MEILYQKLSAKQKKIFDIAVHLFYEKGYTETSVRDIAEKMNILAASLYSHISSKEQLLEWIAQNYLGLLRREIDAFQSKKRDFKEQLQFMIRRNLTVIHDHMKSAEVFRRYFENLSPKTQKQYTDFTSGYLYYLEDVIKNLQVPQKSELDAQLTAKFLMYNMNYAYRWLPTHYSTEQMIEIFENQILFGFLGIRLSS